MIDNDAFTIGLIVNERLREARRDAAIAAVVREERADGRRARRRRRRGWFVRHVLHRPAPVTGPSVLDLGRSRLQARALQSGAGEPLL